MLAALQGESLRSTQAAVESWIEEWGSRTLASLGATPRFDMRNPLVADYLDGFRDVRLVGINDTTASTIRDVIARANEEGQGIDEIRRRIGSVYDDAAGYRAERIARTEVVGSSNAANLAAYQISGLVDGKEWLSVQDDQTRETHADLDGTKTTIDGEFVSSSGNRAQGPGLFGVPAEDINCRCTLVPVIAERAGEVDRVAMWRAFDADVRPGEERIRRAFVEAFERQRRRVLDALR